MPTLQIRNLPQDLYDLLQASAEKSRRSLTQEAIWRLEKSLTESEENHSIWKKKLLDYNSTLPVPDCVSEEDIVNLIRQDRDR